MCVCLCVCSCSFEDFRTPPPASYRSYVARLLRRYDSLLLSAHSTGLSLGLVAVFLSALLFRHACEKKRDASCFRVLCVFRETLYTQHIYMCDTHQVQQQSNEVYMLELAVPNRQATSTAMRRAPDAHCDISRPPPSPPFPSFPLLITHEKHHSILSR